MKIRRAYIYGFYQWIDEEIYFNDQFNYIFGENEAGKSTLQQFVLFVLYGLAPKKRKEAYPKMSSRMGGQLEIEDETYGLFIVERIDGQNNGKAICRLENGEEKDESILKKVLYNIPKKVYTSIFSFSSLDLHRNVKENEDELAATILHIGLSGIRNIQQIEKQLHKQVNDYFKPYGRKPLINKYLTRNAALQREYDKLKSQEKKYNDLVQKTIELDKEIHCIKRKIKSIKSSLLLIEQQKIILPSLIDYRKLTKQMKKYKNTFSISSKFIERFYEIEDELLKLQGEKNILIDIIKNIKKQVSFTRYNELKKKIDELNYFYERISSFREKIAIYKNEIERLENEKEKIKFDLESMEIRLLYDELCEIELPFYLSKEWTNLTNKYEKLLEQKTKYKETDEKLRHDLALNDEQIEKINSKLLSKNEIEKYENKLFKLSHQTNENNTIKTRQENNSSKTPNKLKFIHYITFSIVILIGIFFYKPLLFFSFIFLSLYLWNELETKKYIKQFDSNEIQKQNERLDHLHENMKNKEKLEEIILRQKYLENEQKQLLKKNEQLSRACIEIDEKLFDTEKKLQRVNKEIEQTIQDFPFLQDIHIRYWPDLFTHLINFKKRIQSLVKSEKLIQSLRNEIETFFIQLNNFYTINEKEWTKKLKYFERKYTSILKEYETLDEQLKLKKSNELKLKQLEEKMKPYQIEKNKIKQFVQVETDEDFYHYIEKSKKFTLLKEKLQQLELSLDQVFPREEWLSYNKSLYTQSTLKEKEEVFLNRLERLEGDLQQLDKKKTKINYEINQLENETKFLEVEQQLENSYNTLKFYTKKWLSYQVNYELLKETKREFKSLYFKEVIEKANKYFRHVTDNKYVKINIPMIEKENISFQVVTADGLQFSLKELSTGTIDLFFIILKLSISEVIAENYKLPFILDDIFLHLDQGRKEKMINLLQQMSKNRQVFYFSYIPYEKGDLRNKSRLIKI